MPNFENSSIKLELENYYQNLSASTKNMIEQNSPWYFGAVRDGTNYKAGICKTVNQNIDISTCERTTATTLANIGLLRTGEMFASLISRENSDYFFLITPYDNSYIRSTLSGTTKTTDTLGARITFYLKENVVIAKNNTGNGLYETPYSVELKE